LNLPILGASGGPSRVGVELKLTTNQ